MSVETYYKTQKIRTYSFTYKESYIGEKMLTSLTASNSEGESYSYNFSYEEMQKTADGKQVFFTEPMLWDNGLPLQVGRSSGSGTNYSGGAAAGVGTLFADVTVTGGWNGSSSSSDSFSDYTLSDMNGDGRADSITRGEDGTLWVGLNTGTGFSEKQRIYVNVSALDKSHSTESSTGWTFYAGGRAMVPYVASASLGYSNTGTDRRGTITNQSALMDMDGDGLTDIVETGKNTYLKNMGNLIFEEVPLKTSPSVSVRDISVPLTEEMMEKYQKTYLTETPFRVYVAPEDGTVEIKQNVRRLSLGNNPVRATSYYNSEAVPFREIDLTSGSEVEETDIHDVKKGDRLYFITDTGDDERAGDVKWNIKIRYTKLPLKLSEYKSVYLISEITEGDTDDSVTGDSDEGLTVKDKELEKIEKYKALLKEYEFMPSVFTATLFEEYADELKVKAQSGSDDYSYFEDFPKHWIYDRAEQTYTLTEFEDI